MIIIVLSIHLRRTIVWLWKLKVANSPLRDVTTNVHKTDLQLQNNLYVHEMHA